MIPTRRCAIVRSTALLAVIALGAVGCSDETDPVPPPPVNQAPSIDIAAEDLSVGQGQTKAAAVLIADPEDDEVTVTLASADPALEVLFDDATETITLHASYDISGPVGITAQLADARGQTAEQSFEVQVRPLRWLETTEWTEPEGPEAREHGAMIVDSEAGLAMLVGGSGYSPYLQGLDDVWRHDLLGGTWSPVTPSGDLPSPGGSRRVAQIPGTTTAYLYGGYGDGGSPIHGELYAVDFAGGEASFREVVQQNPPPGRALHAFVYDPATDRFFAFGGVASTPTPFDDTWMMHLEGDTAVWSELSLEPRPSPRYGFFYGFDDVNGRLIVYSGAQGTSSVDPARDTWILDVRSDPPSWQLVAEGDTVPPGRRNGCAIFDPSGPRLWVFGGTPDAQTIEPGLWAFDARPGHEHWTELPRDGEPPLRSSGFGIYDGAGDRTLLGFGNTSSAVFRDLSAIGY